MPTYIYGCSKFKEHPRKEIKHGMNFEPVMRCEVCGNWMSRIPQPFRFYLSPLEILRDWSERNWSKKLRGEPRDYQNVSSERGIPQKDYGARK